MDWKLEVVVVPVSDVDRAKTFYTEGAGFNVDHDVAPGSDMRVVQLTPPGSACSIVIGTGMGHAEPGSIRGLQLVVPDIAKARETLMGRGVAVSEVQQMGSPDRDGGKFAFFEDPDGNGWSVQEIRARIGVGERS
jgi:catechol 2,3-dioxygenase-like lactoylglutathione lyase family enzyme